MAMRSWPNDIGPLLKQRHWVPAIDKPRVPAADLLSHHTSTLRLPRHSNDAISTWFNANGKSLPKRCHLHATMSQASDIYIQPDANTIVNQVCTGGRMHGNGTWLSPFAFSWRLRAAVPFALCSPVCAHWEYRKTKITFSKDVDRTWRSEARHVCTWWWDGWEWHLALSVCVLMAFARCGPVCALRSHLRSLGAQKNKNIFSKRKMLTELKEVKHIIFARDAGMGAWHLARSVCVLMAFARCDPVCALQSRLRSLGIQKNKNMFSKERCWQNLKKWSTSRLHIMAGWVGMALGSLRLRFHGVCALRSRLRSLGIQKNKNSFLKERCWQKKKSST